MSANHLPERKANYTKRPVAFGLAITLGFFAIYGMVLWQSREQDREQARQGAANVIATISADIDRNLELYDLSLQGVIEGMKLPTFSHIDPQLQRLVLFDRAATAKYMGSIFVLDKTGMVVIDSRTSSPYRENYAKRDFFIVHEGNPAAGLFVSCPWLDANGEYLIAISRRLTNADGSFSGAVVGTLRLSYFSSLFGKLHLGTDSAMTLVRDDGTIIMRAPLSNPMIGESVAAYPLFRKIATYPSGSVEYTAGIDGVDRLYVYQRISEYPLIISYGLSVDAIYAGWRQKAWRIGLLMLALCGTNVALIIFLAGAVKQRSEAEHQLAITATTDALTGLCNRRRLDEMIEIEWRRAMRQQSAIALLMIDADHFKTYNDQFGHQSGDVALSAIANCIQSSARRASDISARYGGEEFAVVLPATSLADAFHLAEDIRASVLSLRADQQGRPDSTPTVSIGVAVMIPRQGLQPRDLIKAADTALYRAKSNGRNRTEAASIVYPGEAERHSAAA